MGKHEPAPYAKRNPYDGSVGGPKKDLAAAGAPPKGFNASDGGGWHVFKPSPHEFKRREKTPRQRREKGPAMPEDAAPTAVADSRAAAAEAEPQGPAGELLPPAGYDYAESAKTVPENKRPNDDSHWLLLLALRVAAAAGVIALARSDLAYLMGLSRRRRKREEPAEAPSDTEQV
jgi:hypothetical protein